jgi:hypothetical protein
LRHQFPERPPRGQTRQIYNKEEDEMPEKDEEARALIVHKYGGTSLAEQLEEKGCFRSGCQQKAARFLGNLSNI